MSLVVDSGQRLLFSLLDLGQLHGSINNMCSSSGTDSARSSLDEMIQYLQRPDGRLEAYLATTLNQELEPIVDDTIEDW